MKSAHDAGSGAIKRAAILLLTAVFSLGSSMAQAPVKKTTKKKTVSVSTAASRRTSVGKTSKTPATAVRHSRYTSSPRQEASNGTARVRTRKVIVTRKKVHGRWVRTTQIVRANPGPTYQAHPDTDRYQQIQQALAGSGYFKGQVNGEWGDDSIDALKRFQADHKLPNDGKISALSLIDLGLGPSRDSAATLSSPKAEAPVPQSPTAAPPAASARTSPDPTNSAQTNPAQANRVATSQPSADPVH